MMRSATFGFLVCLAMTLVGCGSSTVVTPSTSSVERNEKIDAVPTLTEDRFELEIGPPPPSNTPTTRQYGFLHASEPIDEVDLVAEWSDVSAPAEEISFPENSVIYRDPITGELIVAPAGNRVKISRNSTTRGSSENRTNTAAARSAGIGLVTDNADALAKLDTKAPSANLEGTGASKGSSGSFAATAVSEASVWVLYLLGGLAVLGGAYIAVGLSRMVTGITISAGGGILIAAAVVAETNPALYWLLFVGAGVMGAGALVYMYLSGKTKKTLDTVVEAIETYGTNSPDEAAALKLTIADTAVSPTVVKSTVAEVKTRLNL